MAATVQYGSKGDDVSQLQTLLNQQGYDLSVDGIFGSATQAAVKQYQQSMGLSIDGVVGANTWGALSGGGGGTSGGYAYSGVTGNPDFTFGDLQSSLNLNTYTPRTAEQLLQEAQNYYDPIFNQTKLSTQQAYDQILQALDQQAAGLQSSYDKQRESTAEAFMQAGSQTERQLLSKGMQRSSYGAQTVSNVGIAGAKAQNEINAAQVRDETNIAQNRVLQQQHLAQTMQQLEVDYAKNIAAYQDQLRNQDYDRAWQSQQAANEAMLNLYQLSLQQYQFERQMSENARQFDASLSASKGSGSGGGSGGGSSQVAGAGTTSQGDYGWVFSAYDLGGSMGSLIGAASAGSDYANSLLKPKAKTSGSPGSTNAMAAY